MFRIYLISVIFISNICLSQSDYDSTVFNYVDSIWKTTVVHSTPVLNLDSSKIDLYRKNFPHNNKVLVMKFGYVQDHTGIYVFEVISPDLERVLCDTCSEIRSTNYPKHTFFKLNYFFDGSTLECYNTYEMLSGFEKEYPVFLESIVDYSYKGFNMPFVVRDEIMYTIRK